MAGFAYSGSGAATYGSEKWSNWTKNSEKIYHLCASQRQKVLV